MTFIYVKNKQLLWNYFDSFFFKLNKICCLIVNGSLSTVSPFPLLMHNQTLWYGYPTIFFKVWCLFHYQRLVTFTWFAVTQRMKFYRLTYNTFIVEFFLIIILLLYWFTSNKVPLFHLNFKSFVCYIKWDNYVIYSSC